MAFSIDFRSLLVWLIWSSRKNYLSVRTGCLRGTLIISKVLGGVPFRETVSYPDGSSPKFGDILSLKDSRERFGSIGDDF